MATFPGNGMGSINYHLSLDMPAYTAGEFLVSTGWCLALYRWVSGRVFTADYLYLWAGDTRLVGDILGAGDLIGEWMGVYWADTNCFNEMMISIIS